MSGFRDFEGPEKLVDETTYERLEEIAEYRTTPLMVSVDVNGLLDRGWEKADILNFLDQLKRLLA